ncbi:MAG TPA: hypothetical protein VGP28_10110 [Methylocella sp.]|nr:hypothetical protein [Methylocella sp.]
MAAPSSGDFTALAQLLADNPDGKLWPGAFATVHFHIPSDPNVLRIPATALIFDREPATRIDGLVRPLAIQPEHGLIRVICMKAKL